jgi:hypothetical protein
MFGSNSNNSGSSTTDSASGEIKRFNMNSYGAFKDAFKDGLKFDANAATKERIDSLTLKEGELLAKIPLAQKESQQALKVATAASKLMQVVESHAISAAGIMKARNEAGSRFIQQAEILNLDMDIIQKRDEGFAGVLSNVRKEIQW